MVRHLVRYLCAMLIATSAVGLVVQAQSGSKAGQNPVVPAIEDPQADFAPGVPRASTPGATPPRIIKQVDPIYSNDALRAGVQGMVTLDAVIGADGSVEQSRVRCSLHPSLDAEAQKALSGWTFKPALLNGVPTRFVVEVRMEFRTHDSGQSPRLKVVPELSFKVLSDQSGVRAVTGCTEH